MKNLYIDTNIFLTFYHFSNEDLKELRKLIAYINTENICLYIPEQTRNEFDRNREVKIADSIDKIIGLKINNNFPAICHNYPEYKSMRKILKEYEVHKNEMLKLIKHDAEKKTLLADEILNELFNKSKITETKNYVLKKAILRYDIGNPPGKDRSYGDAINWECLLNEIPDGEDLFFISDDKDYYSKLDETKFNDYLLNEWRMKKHSDLFYYRKITDFFKNNGLDIEITTDTEKEIIIKNLIEASSFETAKNEIRKLRDFNDFSVSQLNDITTAFTNNNQIYWIPNDYIVYNTRSNIIEANKAIIDQNIYQKYIRRYED